MDDMPPPEPFDELPFEYQEETPPSFAGDPTPRKCRRHRWAFFGMGGVDGSGYRCFRCDKPKDEIRSRRGKQSRNYGTRAELKVANVYGGTKIGHAGGPVDVRGREFNTQVKTHRRLPPTEWRKAFSAMAASGDRMPRLLLRFLPGPGLPPDDYIVVPGKVWLDYFGKDEDAA